MARPAALLGLNAERAKTSSQASSRTRSHLPAASSTITAACSVSSRRPTSLTRPFSPGLRRDRRGCDYRHQQPDDEHYHLGYLAAPTPGRCIIDDLHHCSPHLALGRSGFKPARLVPAFYSPIKTFCFTRSRVYLSLPQLPGLIMPLFSPLRPRQVWA
jgi:hypothetical protein